MEQGIAPSLLISQVRNTAPFLFTNQKYAELPYIAALKRFAETPPQSTFEYFQLCLSAHYSSVACFVPTDVDNQIRAKLWQAPLAETQAMAALVLQSRTWNFEPVTARGVRSSTGWMAGHHGEWFSMAVGAYAAHQKQDSTLAQQIEAAIAEEVQREKQIFCELLEKKDGVGALKAATIIAHNLGDLDRVTDQWQMSPEHPFRKAFYKLGHEGKDPQLSLAGALNKAFMANENHRHFALREPKSLRQLADFLLPIGPFLDPWGAVLGNHPELDHFALLEIVHALVEGIDRLERAKTPSQGYPRALAGITSSFPGGLRRLGEELPVKTRKRLLSGPLYALLQIPQDRFELEWAKKALDFAAKFSF